MVNKKKKAVLKAAELLFSTQGFNETTVADIAGESGIHEASIYAYFSNKRNILFAIYGGYLQNAIETLNEHFQGMKEPGPKLRKSIWHYLADMKNHPNYAKTLMMAQRENPDFYNSEHVRHVKSYSGLVLNIVINGQKEGFFRSDISPRLVRNMAMGASVFAVFDSIVYDHPFDPNELSDLIYQLVFDATATETPGVIEKIEKIKRSDRAEQRRTQILETAINVFSDKGFSNATISDIATHAGLGDATLYEYFDNKEAILLGIADNHLQNLVSDEDVHLADFSEPEQALRKLIWRWIWQLYIHDDFARVLTLELFRNLNFYSSPGFKHLENFKNLLQRSVQRGQDDGVFIENVPFPTYFHMIAGTFDQYLLAQFLLSRPPLGIKELNDIVDALVRAIKVKST